MRSWDPRANEIFLQVLGHDSRESQAACLEAACGGDLALRAEVESLLAADAQAGDFLESPALPRPETTPPVPASLGDFRLLREIGRGGMGVVYEAEQLSLSRHVAIKVLPFVAVLDPKQLQRFHNEALAAASLKHPHIVQVYSVGCERGVHYYAMELVPGQTLAEVIHQLRRPPGLIAGDRGTTEAAASEGSSPEDYSTSPISGTPASPSLAGQACAGQAQEPVTADTDRPQPVPTTSVAPAGHPGFFRTVARWGIEAAEALEHAHQMGVVHRDIKPSNLLIDGQSRLLVTDFGLAQTRAGGDLTLTGDVLGTLRYMSPEQALGNRSILDHRTDIYSLGVTLYELLAQRPPYQNDDRHALIHEIADGNPPPPRQFNRSIPRDLETIVSKAMQAEPQARYATAQQLADDLRRFLADEPVHARRATWADRLAKLARRHRKVVQAAVALLLLTVVVLSLAMLWVVRANKETERRRDEAQNQQRIANNLRLEAEKREAVLREQLYAADVKTAFEGWRQARLEWVTGFLRDTPPDLRGFEWFYLWSLCHQDKQTLGGHQADVCCVAYDRQGRNLASASQDGTVRIWDALTGELRGVLPVGRKAPFEAIAFAPDGATLAATAAEGKVKLFAVATLAEQPPLAPEPSAVDALAYSPDGRLLATAGDDRVLRLYDARTGRRQKEIPGYGGGIRTIVFAPDSRTLASGGDDQTKIWDVASGAVVADVRGHTNTVTCQAFSPDGNSLATGDADRHVFLWNSATWQRRLELVGHADRVYGVAYAPDGRSVVSCSKDGTIRVWDAADGKELNVLRGHVGRVRGVAVSPDGRTVASAGSDGTVRLWDPLAFQEYQCGPASDRGLRAVAFRPDGTLVVSVDTELAFWDVAAGREIKPRVPYPAAIKFPVFAPDFQTLVTHEYETEEQGLYCVTTGQRVAELPRPPGLESRDYAGHSVFSGDGRILVTGWDSTIAIRDLTGAAPLRTIRPPAEPDSIAMSPDQQTVAVGLRTGGVALLDLASGRWRVMLRGQPDTEAIRCVRFSPDGRMLAASGVDRVIRLWDPAAGKQLKYLVGHRHEVVALAFSPDGRTLASASDDQTVRLWRITSGRELLALDSPSKVIGLAFSPDGLALAAGTYVPGRAATYIWRGQSPPASTADENNKTGER